MAKATTPPKVGDNVFILQPECPATYGYVREINGEIAEVETPNGVYDIEIDYLDVDDTDF